MEPVFDFHRSPKRLLHRGRIAVAICSFGFSSLWAQNPCAIVSLGATPTTADITAATNMALGTTACTISIEGPNKCTVVSVQRIINASLGQPCSVYNTHAANLSWTASTTPSVNYNVYRATVSAGPYTKVNTLPIAGTTYSDTTVAAGQTYYYVATAVTASNAESAYSSPPIQATIPTP